jgi:hypothetical protein
MSNDGDIVDTAQEFILLLEPAKATLKTLDRQFLGMAYCAKKRVAECKEQMALAFRTNSKFNNAVTQFGFAKALQENGDMADAIEHFARTYEIEPQNVTYRTDYEASRKN